MNSAVDKLEAVFAVVLEHARQDQDFAKALAHALRAASSPETPPPPGPARKGLKSQKTPVKRSRLSGPDTAQRRRPDAPPVVTTPPTRSEAVQANTTLRKGRCSRALPVSRAAATFPADLAALITERGRRGAQEALLQGPYTVAQLRAFAAEKGVRLRGVGRRRRDLIDAIIASAPVSRAGAFL